MSRKENLISELHPRKGTWKIAVCIIDMWDVKKHNVRQAIDMVLIDQTLDDAIEKNHFVREPLVLMLTLAKIKDAKCEYNVFFYYFLHKYPLSVQNIKNGSKLYVNSNDIAEIRKFRDSLCVPYYVGGVTKKGSGSQSQYTSNSQRSDRDKFLHNAQMVSLGDISRLREDCFCLIVAMVDEVLIDTPWSYVSYPNCTTTFDPLKIMGVCRSCQNQVSHTVPRYKLVLKWNTMGRKLTFIFGMQRVSKCSGGDEIKVFPECVDDLVGKTLALRFKYRVNMR
ncbi:hypothetical protein GmHk_08G023525 [Glycine max]|nr:hypothetical protein GmHk_08G023525 [Glycine max]KAH1238971.1 hypothetical protein GmHk_08G023525 [Glycine max]